MGPLSCTLMLLHRTAVAQGSCWELKSSLVVAEHEKTST